MLLAALKRNLIALILEIGLLNVGEVNDGQETVGERIGKPTTNDHFPKTIPSFLADEPPSSMISNKIHMLVKTLFLELKVSTRRNIKKKTNFVTIAFGVQL